MGRNFASMFEAAADAVPDNLALVHGDTRRTWREFEARSAQLAGGLRAAGLQRESKVALYLYNCNEYLEACFGTFKVGMVPVNVNYRYLEDELAYLVDNSDSEVLLFHGGLADRVAKIRDRIPQVKLLLQIDDGESPLLDGAQWYEDFVASSSPVERESRDGSELFIIYTGGTTGMPKGVLWEHEAIISFYAITYMLAGAVAPDEPAGNVEIVKTLATNGKIPILMPACPLMHGTGWFAALSALCMGGCIVTLPGRAFDPDEIWQVVTKENVGQLIIVGDAFGKPLVQALEEAQTAGRPYDVSSVQFIVSSGVMWSAPVKEALAAHCGGAMMIDTLGSSEGLGFGLSITAPGQDTATAKFQLGENSRVITDDGREVQPGSGEIGVLAVRGSIPLGYYKDPEKSAATFRVVNGVRYSIPGDYATIEADGTITLLGRGSTSINTAGEKVYPEEVEEVIKAHPSVQDCLVVGVPDEKWGEAVTAIVSVEAAESVDEAALIALAKQRLAAFKTPKRIVFVADVPRAPNGKADYKAAKALAIEAATGS